MHISSAFPSDYLKASDVQREERLITMSHVAMEQIGRDRETLPVLYFRGEKKGMVLNKTNSKKIADMYGEETDAWRGCDIILFEAMVEFQGETMPALRVRAPSKAARAQDEYQREAPKPPSQDAAFRPPWEPPDTLITEGEAMAKAGIQSFRSWRDALTPPEYERIKLRLASLTDIANRATAAGGSAQQLESERTLLSAETVKRAKSKL